MFNFHKSFEKVLVRNWRRLARMQKWREWSLKVSGSIQGQESQASKNHRVEQCGNMRVEVKKTLMKQKRLKTLPVEAKSKEIFKWEEQLGNESYIP